MSSTPDAYAHGHHESVLRSHTWRTVENSAAHLIPHLGPGLTVLDVGCGPGTITTDLARRVAPGELIGLDTSAEVIKKAQETRDPELTNCRFDTGDVYNLDFGDDTFDIVHAHQVLQHLTRPVDALREMRRVVKPGGIVAIRDSDYSGMTWAPADPLLDRWMALYQELTDINGVEADAGRYLLGWAQAAGFTDITSGSSTWTYADPETRAWWGDLWADRVCKSSFADQVLEHGLAGADELALIAAAWRSWAEKPDGFFVCPHGEFIAAK